MAMMTVAFMPALSFAGSDVIPLIVNTTDNTQTKTEFTNYNGEDHFVCKVSAQEEILLEIDIGNCKSCALYKDSNCTEKLDGTADDISGYYYWHVNANTDYYAYITTKDAEAYSEKSPYVIAASGAKENENVDMDSSYDEHRYIGYSLTSDVTYKYTAPKTGIYTFAGGDSWYLCDSDGKTLSLSSYGGGCGLIKGNTYLLKCKFTSGPFVMTVQKPELLTNGYKKTASTLSKARKLTAIKLNKNSVPTLESAFYPGKESPRWIKLQTSATLKLNGNIESESMKGTVKVSLYSSSGKLLKTISKSHPMKKYKVSKGTYYIKIVKTSNLATGRGGIIIYSSN